MLYSTLYESTEGPGAQHTDRGNCRYAVLHRDRGAGAPAPAEGGGSVLRLLSNQNFNPTRLIVVSFGAIILLGTFLLHLPISARDGQFTPWLTCLFTATSATCVTGLVLVDSALHWTPFGQGVILAMIQLGGLGFVSLISLIPLLLRRRIGLSSGWPSPPHLI